MPAFVPTLVCSSYHFDIKRNRRGYRIVRDRDGLVGTFPTRKGAVRKRRGQRPRPRLPGAELGPPLSGSGSPAVTSTVMNARFQNATSRPQKFVSRFSQSHDRSGMGRPALPGGRVGLPPR
jgi:hypothetical protein